MQVTKSTDEKEMSTTQTVKEVSNTWYREDVQFGLVV